MASQHNRLFCVRILQLEVHVDARVIYACAVKLWKKRFLDINLLSIKTFYLKSLIPAT